MVADDRSTTSRTSAASMKKWGIPNQEAPELTLLERLVWVKYKTHWWPALIYESYSELQSQLYDQLDMVLKAQFAMAIMRQLQEKKRIKIARLLGRKSLEIIEVSEDAYCEFYWQLPNVLPRACRRSQYGEHMELYFDFHRALDQVEEIIREVSNQNFALSGESGQQSWYARAVAAAGKPRDDYSSVSSVGLNKNMAGTQKSSRSKKSSLKSYKTHMPSSLRRSPSLESNSNSTIATNEISVWSSQRPLTNNLNGVEAHLREPGQGNLSDYRKESSVDPTMTRMKSDLSIKSSPAYTMTGSSKMSRFPLASGSTNLATISSDSSRKSGWDVKSKVSEAQTEVVDNRTETRGVGDSDTDEAREKPMTPIQILPGLEGDDIVPGLSAQVHGARQTWKGVLGVLSGAREDPEIHDQEEGARIQAGVDLVNEMAQQTSPVMEEEHVGFWQRFTCGAL